MPVQRSNSDTKTTVRPGLERRLVYLDQLMVAVLDFTDGPWKEPEPPHSHPHEQISYVSEGHIRFYCEDEPPVELTAGDMFIVPSGKQHTIQLLSLTARLIDAFSPIREEFC